MTKGSRVPEEPARPEPIATSRVIARNLLTNWFYLLASAIVALILTPLIVTKLGLAVYGAWSFINTLVNYAGLIDLGVRGSVGRFAIFYAARGEDREVSSVVSSAVCFLLVAFVVLVPVVYAMAGLFAGTERGSEIQAYFDVRSIALIITLDLGLNFFAAVCRQVLISRDRFDVANALALVSLAMRTALVVWVLEAGYGVTGLAVSSLATNVVLLILLLLAAHRVYPTLRCSVRLFSTERLREVLSYGVKAFSLRASKQATGPINQSLILAFLGAEMVGVYSLAVTLTQYLGQLLQQINATLFPSVIRSGSQADKRALRSLFVRCTRISLPPGVLLCLGCCIFGDTFLGLWIPDAGPAAFRVLQVLSLSALVTLLASTTPSTLNGLGLMNINVVVALFQLLLGTAAAWFALSELGLGIEAVATANLFAVVLIGVGLHGAIAMRAIDMGLPVYTKKILWPALRLAFVAMLVFALIRHWFTADTWILFAAQVFLATAAYTGAALLVDGGLRDLLRRALAAGRAGRAG